MIWLSLGCIHIRSLGAWLFYWNLYWVVLRGEGVLHLAHTWKMAYWRGGKRVDIWLLLGILAVKSHRRGTLGFSFSDLIMAAALFWRFGRSKSSSFLHPIFVLIDLALASQALCLLLNLESHLHLNRRLSFGWSHSLLRTQVPIQSQIIIFHL